jgi:iron(III) transport system substrate-binding protein
VRFFKRCVAIGLAGLFVSSQATGEPPAAGQVVIYAALDTEFSEPILADYARRTGTRVLPKFDVESTKTVGLTQSLIAESRRPRCDVFWNNEIINTIRLQERGLLEPFKPTHGGELPASFKAKDGTWYGLAARARILLVNTKLVAEADRPTSIHDMTNPKWKGKIGIAKPLFGTTATHAACLFTAWGDDKAKAYYRALKANGVQVFSGNKQVAQAVSSGQIAFGMTDTDDAMGEIAAHAPVVIVYPDSATGELGTLFIPNTVAILKNAPHPAEALALADAILAPETETALAEGPSAQIPLLKSTKAKPRVPTPNTEHSMQVDFTEAAKNWNKVMTFLAAEFGS